MHMPSIVIGGKAQDLGENFEKWIDKGESENITEDVLSQ